MKKSYVKDIAIRTGKIAVMPVLCAVVMAVLCASCGASLFTAGAAGNVSGFFKNICYFALLCFGVSINLHTGRMGFDCGAIMVLSTTVGFILGIQGGDNVALAVLVAAVLGCVLSLITGLLYVLLRLPSMIISLGTTLIYEAIAYWIVRVFAYNGNIETIYLQKDMTPNLLGLSSNIAWMVIMALTATALMVVIFHYTKFGFEYSSLQGGQKIAVDTGVKEVKNTLICYAVSGTILGVAGVLNFSYAKAVQPSINFGTVGLMFECFCPLFFGDFLRKYCNKQVAILVGVIAYSFIQTGLGQIRNALNWNNFVIPLINAAILVLFMIFQTNEALIRGKLRGLFAKKAV